MIAPPPPIFTSVSEIAWRKGLSTPCIIALLVIWLGVAAFVLWLLFATYKESRGD